MAEQSDIRPEDLRLDLSAKIVELLARPTLTDLPQNPVGRVLETLRGAFADFTEIDLPEVLDLSDAKYDSRRGRALSESAESVPH